MYLDSRLKVIEREDICSTKFPYGTNIYDTYKRHIRNMYVNICHTCSIYVDIYVNIYVLCEI